MFHHIISALVVSYLKNLNSFFREARRVIKKGGKFIVSMNSPLQNSDYFNEKKAYRTWKSFGVEMPYYPHTFQTIISAILNNSFLIENYIDIKPIKSAKKKFPENYNATMARPEFCLFVLKAV